MDILISYKSHCSTETNGKTCDWSCACLIHLHCATI